MKKSLDPDEFKNLLEKSNELTIKKLRSPRARPRKPSLDPLPTHVPLPQRDGKKRASPTHGGGTVEHKDKRSNRRIKSPSFDNPGREVDVSKLPGTPIKPAPLPRKIGSRRIKTIHFDDIPAQDPLDDYIDQYDEIEAMDEKNLVTTVSDVVDSGELDLLNDIILLGEKDLKLMKDIKAEADWIDEAGKQTAKYEELQAQKHQMEMAALGLQNEINNIDFFLEITNEASTCSPNSNDYELHNVKIKF